MLSDVPPPSPAPPRLSTRDFPAYRYVPGRHPHPLRHAEGHLYGRDDTAGFWDGSLAWRQDEPWCFALDLFNHRYWWEVHEHLEGLWHQVRREQPRLGHGIQGLIQVAVSLLKVHVGKPDAAARLRQRGLEHLGHVQGNPWRGVDLSSLRADLAAGTVPLIGLNKPQSER